MVFGDVHRGGRSLQNLRENKNILEMTLEVISFQSNLSCFSRRAGMGLNPSPYYCAWLLLLLSRFSRVRLCDPIDGSPPGSPVPGFLQARTLEWVAISFSNAWKWTVKVKSLSRVLLFATPRTVAYQAPPSMGFSRQEYWSGLPLHQ